MAKLIEFTGTAKERPSVVFVWQSIEVKPNMNSHLYQINDGYNIILCCCRSSKNYRRNRYDLWSLAMYTVRMCQIIRTIESYNVCSKYAPVQTNLWSRVDNTCQVLACMLHTICQTDNDRCSKASTMLHKNFPVSNRPASTGTNGVNNSMSICSAKILHMKWKRRVINKQLFCSCQLLIDFDWNENNNNQFTCLNKLRTSSVEQKKKHK